MKRHRNKSTLKVKAFILICFLDLCGSVDLVTWLKVFDRWVDSNSRIVHLKQYATGEGRGVTLMLGL